MLRASAASPRAGPQRPTSRPGSDPYYPVKLRREAGNRLISASRAVIALASSRVSAAETVRVVCIPTSPVTSHAGIRAQQSGSDNRPFLDP